jgi:glycosyltransferase involved in cell wall biosynthesis
VLLMLYRDNADNELGPRLDAEFAHLNLTTVVLDRPRGAAGIVANTRRLIGEVRRFAPDVVHLQEDLRDEIVFALPFLRRRAPLLMTIHDPSNHSGNDARRFRFSRFRLYRALVRGRIDGAFAHGAELVRAVEQQLPQLKGRTIAIPHGPLGPHGCPEVVEPAHPSSFLFFGRLHEYKGLRYFVEAIQRLHRAGLPVRGVIAGRGTDLKPNLALIEQTPGAFEVIEKYISEDEVRRLFLETTAAVLPYVDGTQSGVAAMALGYGRPVIATRVGAIPELVRDGVNGTLVTARNVDELAMAMQALVSDRGRWRTLADGALALRSGELSWRQIAATTVSAYRAALQR